MVGEERNLISENPIYLNYYSISRLRRLAELRSSYSEYDDLWIGLRTTFRLFQDEKLGQMLGVPPLNGDLFNMSQTPDLSEVTISNRDLLSAIWHLSMYRENEKTPWRRINYAALDVEELGSIYESLLDFQPIFNERNGRPIFDLVYGTERKSTGSYYTPPELVNELIKSALVPVMEERLKDAKTTKEKEKAILNIKVCDPASGSGHFLLAAARRLGRELAKIRTGDDEPAPEQMRLAIRDVITHCIYGVDKNPLAVDLCKVALWIEGHTKGKPLTFLDHRIRCGDSLIGVFDLNVLKEGIPDEAFEPVSGDDKATARMLKKRNRDERSGQRSLPLLTSEELRKLGEDRRPLLELPDDTPEQIRQKVNAYQNLQRQGTKWWQDQTACHLWTSAFFTELTAENDKNRRIPTTDDLFRYLETHNLDGRLIGNAWALAQKHKFFHWPLEFPEVLGKGGFDVVLGNPPFSAEMPLGLVKLLHSINFSVSNINSAALFVQRTHQLLNFKGQLGLVNPKSLTYSQRWSSIRKLLIPHLRTIIDCGHAWKLVLLEQIIFSSSKAKSENGVEVGAISGSERKVINRKLLTQINIIPCDVEKIAFDIVNRLSAASISLGSVCKTFRGAGIQRILSESGKFPVLGGKDIARYRIRGVSGFLSDEFLYPKLEFLRQPKIIYQNIIAYVQSPQPHIKIAAYYDHDGIATLDTVNNVIPTSNNINPWAVTGLLNSKVLNWIAWRFLYNKAQRTMHFDQYFLDRLLVPKSFLNVQSEIGMKVQEIQTMYKAGKRDLAEIERLVDEIDRIVTECFELTEFEKNVIYAQFPQFDL